MLENNNQLNNDSEIKTIHTFESDMAGLIREGNGSVADIAIAEQERRRANPRIAIDEKVKIKNLIFIAGGLAIILLSVWLTIFLVNKSKTNGIAQVVETKIPTPVPYDSQTTLDVTSAINKDEFAKILTPELGSKLKAGTIKAIFLNINNNLLNTSAFLKLINANMPGALARSLSDNFMLGEYSSTSNHLFLLFQTKDYNQTYAGMLTWEKTMLSDMYLLFNIDVSGDRQQLFETSWSDIVISNKDARVLSDPNDVPVLYYLSLDNNTFVITDNQETIKEIISRLVTQNIKPL